MKLYKYVEPREDMQFVQHTRNTKNTGGNRINMIKTFLKHEVVIDQSRYTCEKLRKLRVDGKHR